MNKLGIKHIFFDLDHTLWDFDRNSMLAFRRMFEAYSIPVPLEDFIKVYEPINFEYWKMYREERIDKQGLRRGRFLDSFKPFGVTFSMEEIDTLATSYIDELPKDNYLFDGVTEMLDYLLYKGYEMHIITNGFEEVQHLKLRNSSIDHFFRTVTTSEEVGVKKPNPLVFYRALEKASAQPLESIMVGDTFEADILGAEEVGMHTLFFNYRKENPPAQYRVINRITDIKNHL
ncbi:YjjG family noncanonical pyrimidine nucleotidase [Aureisphaera galaxeae]|uniref:YjjG family noncanonical pyrimidine nucleotidase n=1 Tax=Aureisphaera galaxeae TaxID=1538023 RepID=UPI00234FD005|nr:YjjG family noncanonical pyrimidine nucleotidase [Aureisphaera galaxeae]MDC8005599.1 YjjG family noncanonical pyrimidine nucleotidase [Aureisphaera galaxeae]